MNKILISVLAVAGIAGGGYYFVTQEHIDTVASYLPEPISSFISDKPQAEEMAKGLIAEQAPRKQNVAVQHNIQNKPIAPPVVNEVVINEQNIKIEASRASDAERKAALAAVNMIDVKVKNDSDKSVELNFGQETSNENAKVSINMNSQSAIKVEKKAVAREVKIGVKTKETPEVLKLESELKSVQKDVMQIDGENKMLKARFQKILKKNRDLALELKRINDKIQVAN